MRICIVVLVVCLYAHSTFLLLMGRLGARCPRDIERWEGQGREVGGVWLSDDYDVQLYYFACINLNIYLLVCR